MSLKKYFAVVLSLGILAVSLEALCTKIGHTVTKKKWVNRKTGEVHYTEEVVHHSPSNLTPGTALVENTQSNGISTSALVNRDDLNATANETGIDSLPFRTNSCYELETGLRSRGIQPHASCQTSAQTYESYQASGQLNHIYPIVEEETIPIVLADSLESNTEEGYYASSINHSKKNGIQEVELKIPYISDYGSTEPFKYKPNENKYRLKRFGATALGIATSASGFWICTSALERMKIPLADEITCKKSNLNYYTYHTGRPTALIHTSTCQPCSFFQTDYNIASGYEGTVCYTSALGCCSHWNRRLTQDDGWSLDSSTSVTYNDDTFHATGSSYTSSASSSYSRSKNKENTENTCHRIYSKQVAICPPESAKAEYTMSFTYQGKQEKELVQCPHTRSFIQSEFAQYCNVHNDLMNFVARYNQNEYTCYLKKEGRDEHNLCKSVSDGKPWHHGKNLKIVAGVLVTGLGPVIIWPAIIASKNMYN